MPDFKIIADIRRDNGKAVRNICRQLDLFSQSLVAIRANPISRYRQEPTTSGCPEVSTNLGATDCSFVVDMPVTNFIFHRGAEFLPSAPF